VLAVVAWNGRSDRRIIRAGDPRHERGLAPTADADPAIVAPPKTQFLELA